MSTRARLFIALLLVAVLLLAFWWWDASLDIGPTQHGDLTDSVRQESLEIEEPDTALEKLREELANLDIPEAPPATESRPSEPPAPEPRVSVSLHVLLVWDDDDTPATDLRVAVHSARGRTRTGTSDANGAVNFELDRSWVNLATIVTENGTVVEHSVGRGKNSVTVRVPRGEYVLGQVVDEFGVGVPNADIWLSSGALGEKGRVVAQSDLRGQFHLRAVAWHRWIGARKEYCGPSNLVRVDESTTGNQPIELVVERNGSCVTLRLARGQRHESAELLLWVLRPPADERTIGGTGQTLPPPPYFRRFKKGKVHFKQLASNVTFKALVARPGALPTISRHQLVGPNPKDPNELEHKCNRRTVSLHAVEETIVSLSKDAGVPRNATWIEFENAQAYGPWQNRVQSNTGQGFQLTLDWAKDKPPKRFVAHSAHGIGFLELNHQWRQSMRLEARDRFSIVLVDRHGDPLPGWRLRVRGYEHPWILRTSRRGEAQVYVPDEWPLTIQVFPPGHSFSYAPIVTETLRGIDDGYLIRIMSTH